MKSLLFLITVILTVVECKPVADSSKLPHSREFYAGYIKAITDNFDQLFETDRQTRSTKEEDESKTKDDKGDNLDDEILKQKRDIVIEDDFDEKKKNTIPSVSETSTTEDNIPVEEDFKESPAVKRAVVQDGSGNSDDESVSEEGSGSEGDDVTDETTKKTNENEDEKETEKADSNIIENKVGKVNEYTPEKDVVGLSSRRSEEGEGGGPPGDEEEDIREANADMQKSSRDQSPDELAKMAQSTVTFLPTNVRNYKASPYVKKVFHYDPQPIPYGGFRSDAEVDGEPMPQRHFAGMHAPNGMYNPMAMGRNNGPPMNRHYPEFGFMFPRNPETDHTSNHAETRNQIENAFLDNKVPSAANDNQAATFPVPVGEPESVPPSQIVDSPVAPETDKQVKALKKDGCCCEPCCCEQHCCCCHPVCHHVTHHHHHMNDICHHKHHHDIYHHETKVHPHHECCHHVYNHQHIHPHEHCHVCHHHEKQIHHHHPCCCCHDDCCHHDDCHHDDCCHHDCGCHDCGHHDGGYGGGSSNGGGSYGGGSY